MKEEKKFETIRYLSRSGKWEETIKRDYDVTDQERVVRGRMPLLEVIYEKFIYDLDVNLPSLLLCYQQHSMYGLDLDKYGGYVNSVRIPTYFAIVESKSFDGEIALQIDPELCELLVSKLLLGEPVKSQKRLFYTPTDFYVIRMAAQKMIDSLNSVFKSTFKDDFDEFKIVRDEINPQMLSLCHPHEVVIISTFEMIIDGIASNYKIVFKHETLTASKLKFNSALKPRPIPRPKLGPVDRNQKVEVKEYFDLDITNAQELLDLKEGSVIRLNGKTAEIFRAINGEKV